MVVRLHLLSSSILFLVIIFRTFMCEYVFVGMVIPALTSQGGKMKTSLRRTVIVVASLYMSHSFSAWVILWPLAVLTNYVLLYCAGRPHVGVCRLSAFGHTLSWLSTTPWASWVFGATHCCYLRNCGWRLGRLQF